MELLSKDENSPREPRLWCGVTKDGVNARCGVFICVFGDREYGVGGLKEGVTEDGRDGWGVADRAMGVSPQEREDMHDLYVDPLLWGECPE